MASTPKYKRFTKMHNTSYKVLVDGIIVTVLGRKINRM